MKKLTITHEILLPDEESDNYPYLLGALGARIEQAGLHTQQLRTQIDSQAPITWIKDGRKLGDTLGDFLRIAAPHLTAADNARLRRIAGIIPDADEDD